MKLLTHNMLMCNAKGVKNGYPLRIEVTKKEVRECEMNIDFLRSFAEKLEWAAFREAAVQIGEEPLPEAVTPELLKDDAFLKRFHRALLEVQVEEGALVCPESGRRFVISNFIPNMLLNEDEV